MYQKDKKDVKPQFRPLHDATSRQTETCLKSPFENSKAFLEFFYFQRCDTIELAMRKRKIRIAKFTAIFEPAEEGGYTVVVPSLPGCVTEGDTLEEAVKMVKDAIQVYIESLKKHNEPIPQEEGSSFVGVIDVPISHAP